MATVKAILRKRGTGYIVNSNNEGTVLVQYQHQQKCCWFSTQIKIKPECWNGIKQVVDKTKGISNNKINGELLSSLERESRLCNALIETIKSRVSTIARDFQIKDTEPTSPLVKAEYEKKYKAASVKVETET